MSKISDAETVTVVAVVGIGAYLVYKFWNDVLPNIPNPLAPIGNAISNGLFNLMNPNAAGDNVDYTVAMPDGTYASVPSASVNALGQTTIGGATYQINTNSAVTSGVNKTATPISMSAMDSTIDDMDFSAGNF